MFDNERILVHFSEDEFRRSSFCLPDETKVAEKIQQDPLSLLDWNTCKKLDQTRDYAGIPFRLNCSYRSVLFDLTKGRSGDSAHCKGFAFDIAATTDRQRFLIVRAAILCGWKRIGVSKNFIHLDDDPSKNPERLWTYV